MKKLFLYIFLGLILCNTGFARTTGCVEGDCEDGVGTWTYTTKPHTWVSGMLVKSMDKGL